VPTMGVPFLYKWIVSHFRGQRSVVVRELPASIYSLSFDLNGLIHKAAQITYAYGSGVSKMSEDEKKKRNKLLKAMRQEDRENEFIKTFEFLLRDAIGQINPTELLIIAIDGLAPAAKIQQQRQRRYKASLLPQSPFFDSNAITPGTEFMRKLNEIVQRFILAYRSNLPPKIRYSPSTGVGEGEHKIMDIFRGLAEYVQPEAIKSVKGKPVKPTSASQQVVEPDSKADLLELQLIDRISKNPILVDSDAVLDSVMTTVDWNNASQRLSYRSFRASNETRKTVHLKERKIYLALLDFLTLMCTAYGVTPDKLSATIVYVCQPSLESHVTLLMKKFPTSVWHLYYYGLNVKDDGFKLKDDQKSLFVHKSFSDDIAKEWSGKCNFFISDPAISDDLLKVQERWVSLLRSQTVIYHLLKFVLPFNKDITPYFDGTLRIQAYTSQASTESRLITLGNTLREYNNKYYEEWFYYYNTIIRQYQKYIIAVNPGKQFKPESINDKYIVSTDNMLEILFDINYFRVSQQEISFDKISTEMKSVNEELKTTAPVKKISQKITTTSTDSSKTVPPTAYHAIYGLDADLIMLSLISPIKNILLVREDVRDILDINQLRINLREILGSKTGTEIDDFVLMMFMVGNDFLPHAPALPNIETAVDILVSTYKEVGLSLTNPKTGAIRWPNFIEFLGKLKDKEPELLNDVAKIPVTNPSKAFQQSVKYSTTPVSTGKPLTAFGGSEYKVTGIDYGTFRSNWYGHCFNAKGSEEAKRTVLSLLSNDNTQQPVAVPSFLSGITPLSVTPREVKEQDLFKPFYQVPDNTKIIEQMCVDYMKAMAFVYLYYRKGTAAINMQFYYPYNYAPMLVDLYSNGGRYLTISPDVVSNEVSTLGYDSLDQLLAVLPAKSQNLLPPSARFFYNSQTPIVDLFPSEFLIDRDGTNKDYQGIAIIPFVDMLRISQASSYIQYADRQKLFGVGSDMDYQLTDQQRAAIATQKQIAEDKKEFAKLRSQYGFSSGERGRGRGGRGRGVTTSRGGRGGRGRGISTSRGGRGGREITPRQTSGSGSGAGAARSDIDVKERPVVAIPPPPTSTDNSFYDELFSAISATKK
jgi:hypothetical protein